MNCVVNCYVNAISTLDESMKLYYLPISFNHPNKQICKLQTVDYSFLIISLIIFRQMEQ